MALKKKKIEGLGEFDGRPVGTTSISVTNAGDGLSEALAVDPQLLHLGDTVIVVLECEVSKIRFLQAKGTDELVREHVLKAGGAALIDRDLVSKVLDEQANRIENAKLAAAGVTRIPGTEEAAQTRRPRGKKAEAAAGLKAVGEIVGEITAPAPDPDAEEAWADA